MKRILLTILAIMAMLPLAAQTDTTQLDTIQRRIDTVLFPLIRPNYYQNEWLNGQDGVDFTVYEYNNALSLLDARRYEIPDSLRIIGLAGIFGITNPDDHPDWHYTYPTIEARLPEYLQLYECTPDTIRLIKQMPWVHADAVCHFDVWAERYYHRFPALYEVYFDEPIVVRDSFYVGGTEENDDVGYMELLYFETTKYAAQAKHRTDSIVMRVRKTHASNPNTDTTRWWVWKTLREYMLFPIIDTTGMNPPDTTHGGDTTIVDTTTLDTTGISRLADQFSQIFPNPTTGHASVYSSIPMRSVAIYDPQGRCILRRRVNGTIVHLDLEGHARGQYYVVIDTPAGRALKRLLVQ